MKQQCCESTVCSSPSFFSPLFSAFSSGILLLPNLSVSQCTWLHSSILWCPHSLHREGNYWHSRLCTGFLSYKIEVMVKNYMPLDHKEMGLGANLFTILIYSGSEKIMQSARFNERLQFNQGVLLRSYNLNSYSTSWLSYSLDNSVLCCYLWG